MVVGGEAEGVMFVAGDAWFRIHHVQLIVKNWRFVIYCGLFIIHD